MKLKATNHSYYCSDSNYYIGNSYGENFGRCVYETWRDFKEAWLNEDLTIDHDYNHCFRFDINPHRDYETDKEIEGKFSLDLYFMLQRKGIFRPVHIKEIAESDMPEIEKYLSACWNYIKGQWEEFSTVTK
ncbi:hypothetical protein AB1283_00825 [Bacillus sp. S13(2024)]|uniref:hypothetical protein n=1 Tax=Bacillus sp. S13(2024) TaxID=3162885 RepID=UPI003D25302D